MSVEHLIQNCNPSSETSFPEQLAAQLARQCQQIQDLVQKDAEKGREFNDVERGVWQLLLKTGFQAMQLFVSLQGDGDLGETIVGAGQKQLHRSTTKTTCCVRSVFGEHHFQQYAYSPGVNRKVELRPVSARMQLPQHRWSYMLQEFSQWFCVDQAFHQASDSLQKIFGSAFSVDTLEQTSHRMGVEAGSFLDELPKPAAKEEDTLLVASADCKGVPLVKQEVSKVAAFETAKTRPGNRRMATVTCVYTVKPFERTAEQIVSALFRDDKQPEASDRPPQAERPRPKNKHTTAHFPTLFHDGELEVPITGIHEGITWLAAEVSTRKRQKTQALLLVMDGQESLWDAAWLHFASEDLLVEILDIIHVSTYVWEASSLFCRSMDEREKFTRDRLLRILGGEVLGVIRGLRRQGTTAGLEGEKLADLKRICGYFEKHADRMRYDEYLSQRYPIASGPIEGACGHLVKDRMERSGMRWTLEGARNMLNVRALFQSDYWDNFHEQRVASLTAQAHPNRELIQNYQPLTLAG